MPALPGMLSEIAITGSTACALEADGSPRCWGFDDSGQAQAPTMAGFSQLATTVELGCALNPQGLPACWGTSGAIRPPAEAFVQLAAGSGECTCGLKQTGDVSCWGSVMSCQMVSRAPAGVKLSALAVGDVFACGIGTGGLPMCWGMDPPTPPAEKLQSLSISPRQVCGLRVDHTAVCWAAAGANATTPPHDEHFREVRAGIDFACGLRESDGSVVCWGDDSFGQSTPPAR